MLRFPSMLLKDVSHLEDFFFWFQTLIWRGGGGGERGEQSPNNMKNGGPDGLKKGRNVTKKRSTFKMII